MSEGTLTDRRFNALGAGDEAREKRAGRHVGRLPESSFNALGAGDEARELEELGMSEEGLVLFQCPRCGR